MTKETGMNMKVPFTLAKKLFHKNTIEDKPTFVEKITNEEGFEKFLVQQQP